MSTEAGAQAAGGSLPTARPLRPTPPPNPRLMGQDDDPKAERLYRRMRFIRRFEETVLTLFEEGLLTGTTHCAIGQEADAVGIAEHLAPGDHIFSHHRGHAHYLARTGDAFGLLCELMGKAAGVCGGVGGSQHVAAPGFKSNGILGGTVPAAAGIAWAYQLERSRNISLAFIGDGTLGEGVVYESLNIASRWKLPLWLILEDNGWSQSTRQEVAMAGSARLRFEAFGIPVTEVETTDVDIVDRIAREDSAHVRNGQGPQVTIIHTYRLCSHSKSDDGRPKEEVAARWDREPLRVHGPRLAPGRRTQIDDEVELALRDVVRRAREAA